MSRPRTVQPVVTVAFGTTVAMWAIGYVCRLPRAESGPGGIADPLVPAWLLLVLMLACLVAGGVVLGRRARAGVGAGALAGVATAILNLLVLGSLVTGDAPNEVHVPSALLWIPGAIVLCAVLMAAGTAAGRMSAGAAPSDAPDAAAPDDAAWRHGFAFVACVATLLVVIAGGLVTGLEAGQAVPDWPTSFGSNMFLYPLSRMTGGIYYEHAHRLYGSLVGVTTVVLAVILLVADERRWMKALGLAAVVAVIAQGLAGGIWVRASVENGLPMPIDDRPAALAVGHGVFGQVFFAGMVLIWAFTSRAWRTGPRADALPRGADGVITAALVAACLAQLTFGAIYRHTFTVEKPLSWPMHAHLVLAAVVAVLAYTAAVRAWSKGAAAPALGRAGKAMLVVVSLQILFGFAALLAVLARKEGPAAAEVIVTTVHQANGAIMLAIAGLLAAWTRRLTR